MTNLEKYFGVLNDLCLRTGDSLDCTVAQIRNANFSPGVSCNGYCEGCRKGSIAWLLYEYEPPKELENGDNLKRGQLIEVSQDQEDWCKRQFLAYIDGSFWCFVGAWPSGEAFAWKHARLPEKEEC